MRRLSSLDAAFLRAETETGHMHVGWLSTLELPDGTHRLDLEALEQRIASRLHLVPRFRQRVVESPLGIGEPYWQDDTEFDLRRHIKVIDGDPSSLDVRRITDAFLSRPLARDRPLWEIAVVPRLGRGRAATLGKIHHAMVDGVAAVELGMLLFDVSPEGEDPQPRAWDPSPANGPIRLAIDSVGDSALEQFRAARRVAELGLSPGRGLRVADTMRRAAMSLAEDALRPAPASYLNAPIGAERTLVVHGVPMRRLLRLKEHTETTLNDVLLAVAAGAMRRLAFEVGEEPHDLRVLVPVNVRGSDDPREGGNRITFAFIELPISDIDAARRLRTIRERTLELKSSGRVAGSDMVMRSLAALPTPLKTPAARLAASPRLYNFTVSNVPGPRMPLYAAGARVRSIYPVIPVPDRHALAIGVLTYDTTANFAAYADPEALPEVNGLPIMLENSVGELELVTDTRPRSRSRSKSSGGPERMNGHRRRGPAASRGAATRS
jgi:diacylglycerol O-acyltransferase / wax synthase